MTVTLTFCDLIDLQSRLVLLPRIEEEGLGAIVASYSPAKTLTSLNTDGSRFQEEKKSDEEEAEGDVTIKRVGSMDSIALNADQEENDEEVSTAFNDKQPVQEPIAPTPEESTSDQPSELEETEESPTQLRDSAAENDLKPEDIVGKVLIGIDGVETEDDWLVRDFAQILASTRAVKSPIVLRFDSVPLVKEEDGEEQEEAQIEKPMQQDESEASLNSWSSWGKSFAATAASNAKVYASATATAVAKAADEARAARQAKAAIADMPSLRDQKCYMFLQMGDGQFMELSGCPPQKLPKVTTTSIVVLRQSPSQPCPTRCYRFQWFRSYSTPKGCDMSSNSSRASSSSNSRSGSFDADDHQWTILEGATYSAYQPSANDVGHRLRCVVSIEVEDEEVDFAGDDASVKEEIITCEAPAPVAADMSMFNGARQALSRGAHFGNLVGRGPAEGRVFGIHIELSFADDRSISSATSIQQISGKTREPIHLGVIKQASAIANPANPKQFDLVFPFGLPEGSCMVSALSTDGRFQLTTPNRLTRETLLLALGIANFSGKPADLTETTVLYPGLVQYPGLIVKDIPETPVKHIIQRSDDGFFAPEESIQPTNDNDEQTSIRIRALELELQQTRSKLSRKDKVVSDLQRQLSQSDSKLQKTERNLSLYQQDLKKTLDDSKDCRKKLRLAEKRSETHEANMIRVKGDHAMNATFLEKRIVAQSEKISELEKSVRSHQNEKAVLSAAVEARDSKLEKMNGLQTALDSLSVKVAKGDSLRSEMTDLGRRYAVLCSDLEKVAASETECKEQLQMTLSTMNELCQNLESETTRRKQCQKELENVQRTTQTLKSERNSYKQKSESLTKEVGRLCRGGRTLQDVEKVLTDEVSRKTEIEVLRSQKKKALEDLHQYRSAYEQQLVAQLNMGVDGAALKALEQKAELERVVSDLTEYINAKEMQLETMRQVNEALTDEMKQLAKANMDKNDI
jgi:hypothetical protein